MNRYACVLMLFTLLLGGCAVQQSRPGQMQIGLDLPEMLGKRVASFKLADGSEGSLRELNGAYSLKLQRYFKVVDIRQAREVRLLSTEQFGDRTTLVLEKTNGNCQHLLELLSIRGSDVSSWSFGDCNQPMQIQREGDALVFERTANNRIERIVYQDERVVRQRQNGAGTTTVAIPGRAGSGAPLPSAPPRSGTNRPGDGAPVVSATAARHQPGLPITSQAFRADLKNEPTPPDPPSASAPQQPRAVVAGNTERAGRDTAPPPPRPRTLAGATVEDLSPIRIKLD